MWAMQAVSTLSIAKRQDLRDGYQAAVASTRHNLPVVAWEQYEQNH